MQLFCKCSCVPWDLDRKVLKKWRFWMQNFARSQQHEWATIRSRHLPPRQEFHPPKIGSGIDPFPNVPFSLLDQKESISGIYTTNKSPNHYKSTHKLPVVWQIITIYHKCLLIVLLSPLLLVPNPSHPSRQLSVVGHQEADLSRCWTVTQWPATGGWKQALHPRYL